MGTVQPLRRKVAIVGTQPSWIEAPTDDSDWEVWGLNGVWAALPRWDRWFEMHTPEAGFIEETYGAGYVEFLRAAGKPVYMQETVAWVPSSVRYPVEEMAARFGDVWACTPAYMLALAITEGFEQIGIYGMDNIGADEYVRQREWMQYLRGFAAGRGIKVTFPPESGSAMEAHGYRYGYEAPPVIDELADVTANRERALALKHREKATERMFKFDGACTAFDSVRRAKADGILTDEFVANALTHAIAQRGRAAAERIEWEGAVKSAARIEKGIAHIARRGAA